MSKPSTGRQQTKSIPLAGEIWVADKGEHKGYRQLILGCNGHTVKVTIAGKQAAHTGGGKKLTVPLAQFLARHSLA